MSALVDLLPTDIVRHVYGDWLSGYDAMRWQCACVFVYEPTAMRERALYPVFAQTRQWLVYVLRSVPHRLDEKFQLRHLAHAWFETARIVPCILDYGWYTHALMYPWLSTHASDVTLQLTECDIARVGAPVASVRRIYVVPSHTDWIVREYREYRWPLTSVWPNVRELVWWCEDSGETRWLTLSVFPNLERLQLEGDNMSVQSGHAASRLHTIDLTVNTISLPHEALPALTTLVAPQNAGAIYWACSVQRGARLVSLDVGDLAPPPTCDILPALSVFTCNARVLAAWLPFVPNVRHLHVTQVASEEIIDVKTLRLDRFRCDVLCSVSDITDLSLATLIDNYPYLAPWIIDCPTAHVCVDDGFSTQIDITGGLIRSWGHPYIK